MSDIVTKDNERVISFFKSIDRMLDGLQNLVANHKPQLNGERYLTDYEVSQRLKLVAGLYRIGEMMVKFRLFYWVVKFCIPKVLSNRCLINTTARHLNKLCGLEARELELPLN